MSVLPLPVTAARSRIFLYGFGHGDRERELSSKCGHFLPLTGAFLLSLFNYDYFPSFPLYRLSVVSFIFYTSGSRSEPFEFHRWKMADSQKYLKKENLTASIGSPYLA